MAKSPQTADREDDSNKKYTREGLPYVSAKTLERFMQEFTNDLFSRKDFGSSIKLNDYIKKEMVKDWSKELQKENENVLEYIEFMLELYPEGVRPFTKAILLGLYRLVQDEARNVNLLKFLGFEGKPKENSKGDNQGQANEDK